MPSQLTLPQAGLLDYLRRLPVHEGAWFLPADLWPADRGRAVRLLERLAAKGLVRRRKFDNAAAYCVQAGAYAILEARP